MIHETRSVQETIDFLNELLKLDEPAITRLIESRVACNEDLTEHPTVQVQDVVGAPSVGLLGILNGLFGTDEKGWGPITAVVEDDGTISSFKRTEHKS